MFKKISLVLLCIPFGLHAAPELKGTPKELEQYFHPQQKTMHLSEQAEKTAYTDVAIIDLVIKTEDKALARSIEKNDQIQRLIYKSLVNSGVDADSIQNAKFSSSPEFGWFGDKPKSFNVVNRMSVKINNAEHLQKLAQLSDQHDEVSLASTEFEHSEKEKFEQAVKKQALDKIMAKKAFYEAALGLKLTAISFHESNIQNQPTMAATMLRQKAKPSVKNAEAFVSYSAEQSHQRANSFDEVKYKASITVEFKVE
ncbi:SIMPL domain-containing protein [Catenovulum maritimum]|uniref:DUF541 domain-containing protein n=1 Tax=Catenovulum maritimum TaxID=1513271 RepID=A0A0J8GM69_9ALTE|nr:SIMPL domain-containing protein [Catenovulum maritimum]KMT63870.1 hypothetical protein XM47_17515 [Catenovulum maritimum]